LRFLTMIVVASLNALQVLAKVGSSSRMLVSFVVTLLIR
jgi:hypothetical protein